MNYTVLPSGYRRIGGVDLLQDRRSMLIVNLGAIVIALLLLLLGLRLHPFRFSIRSMPSFLLWFFLLLGGLVLYIILHELIHGIFMRHYSGLRPRYGFNGLYAYAGSDAFFDRKSYLVISLAPVVLLGRGAAFALRSASLLPLLVFLSAPDPKSLRCRGRSLPLPAAAKNARRPADSGQWRSDGILFGRILTAKGLSQRTEKALFVAFFDLLEFQHPYFDSCSKIER